MLFIKPLLASLEVSDLRFQFLQLCVAFLFLISFGQFLVVFHQLSYRCHFVVDMLLELRHSSFSSLFTLLFA